MGSRSIVDEDVPVPESGRVSLDDVGDMLFLVLVRQKKEMQVKLDMDILIVEHH